MVIGAPPVQMAPLATQVLLARQDQLVHPARTEMMARTAWKVQP
jgi:hypothetical protein